MKAFGASMVGVAGILFAAAPAQAGGSSPYYGFSGYFGGPATYYTRDTDVQQATTMRDGSQGAGVRTYTPGGPFWRYKPVGGRPLPRRYDDEAIRVKG